MDENENVSGDTMLVCPECGGKMADDEGDPSMMHCEKCGYAMSSDEARGHDEESETNE